MDLVKSTAAPSPALKSTAFNYPAHRRGLGCERQVINRLTSKGYKLLAERVKLGGVEVDLLFDRGAEGILIVEVKSLSCADWLEFRLSAKQRLRLYRAAESLMAFGFRGRRSNQIEIWLALVGPNPSAIEFLPI